MCNLKLLLCRMVKKEEINDYDSEPVKYCAKCYSLKVMYDDTLEADYCGDCGCSDILETSVEVWEKKYEERYGHKFAVKNEDPRKSFIFSLTLEQLKTRVYKSEKWKEIVYALYPNFPAYYSKADSLILFFHTIIMQGRLNDLKLLLFKMFKY